MTILAKIKSKIRDGDYRFSLHAMKELNDDSFLQADAISAIKNAVEFDRLTGDESHIRYLLYGLANDGRALNVVVFFSQGTLVIKTAYEEF